MVSLGFGLSNNEVQFCKQSDFGEAQRNIEQQKSKASEFDLQCFRSRIKYLRCDKVPGAWESFKFFLVIHLDVEVMLYLSPIGIYHYCVCRVMPQKRKACELTHSNPLGTHRSRHPRLPDRLRPATHRTLVCDDPNLPKNK